VLGVAGEALDLVLILALGVGAGAWWVGQRPVAAGGLLARAHVAQTGVSFQELTLRWRGWVEGPGAPVERRARGLEVATAGFQARLGEAKVALLPGPLLRGTVAPVSVVVRGAAVQLKGAAGGGTGAGIDFGTLRTAAVENARVEGPGGAWSVRVVHGALTQRADRSAEGNADATVTVGAMVTAVQARGVRQPGGALHVDAETAAIDPPALAAAFPALAGAAAVQAPVTLRVGLDLSSKLAPVAATVHGTLGAGRMVLDSGEVPVQGVTVDARLAWSGGAVQSISVQRLAATLSSPSGAPPTALEVSGEAHPASGGWQATVAMGFDQIAAADLGTYWPPKAVPHARSWVVENITRGTLRAGQFQVTLQVLPGFADANLVAAGGTMQGEDLTLYWLRPALPMEHVRATLTFVNPDVIEVVIPSGAQGGLRVSAGQVRFTGLAAKDQFAAISLELSGSLASTVALLSQPKLQLLSAHKLPFRVAGGVVTDRLTVQLPLIDKLRVDDVKIATQAQMTGVRLLDVVAGHGLRDGAVQVEATNDGLRASGRGELGGVATEFRVTSDFRAGPPSEVVVSADVSGAAGTADLLRNGIDLQGVLAGRLDLTAHYDEQRDGDGALRLAADLRGAAVVTPVWRKPAGAVARASANVAFHDGKLAAIEDVEATGPGLRIAGRAEISHGQPDVLQFREIVLDGTRATGVLRLPGACARRMCVRLEGPVLDLSAGLTAMGTGSGRATPARSGGPGTPWRVEARFGRVLLRGGRTIGPVAAMAEDDGRRVVSASLTAPGVNGRLVPVGTARVVMVRAADFGGLLGAAGVSTVLHGGGFALDGRFDDAYAGSPFTGMATLERFSVQKAVVAGKILQALTIFGVVDALRGPGLIFARAIVPFRFERGVLSLVSARASSASLGVTATGLLDFGRDAVRLDGTIVPAYILNSALGRLPVVGRFFSPERGGGVVAANVTVRGKLDDPSVRVNPLAALTPGFMRGLFNLF